MGQMFRKWGWQKDAIFWIGCHLKPFITILQKKRVEGDDDAEVFRKERHEKSNVHSTV